jgi:O-methyltransferase
MSALRFLVDKVLHPLGLHLTRYPAKEMASDSQPHMSALREIEGCFRELVFPEIPIRQGRIELMANLLGTNPSEAMYLIRSLCMSLARPGDVCEFGVAQGATSALIANEIRDTDKRLWLFDSFKGLPKPSNEDELIDDIFNLGSMEAYTGTMACDVSMVKSKLNDTKFPLERVQIVPGFIEETSKSENLPQQVCFAYVDFDFYEPILIALELLDRRLPSGGHVVVDDYGWFSSGAQKAVDRFIEMHSAAYELNFPNKSAGHFALIRKK